MTLDFARFFNIRTIKPMVRMRLPDSGYRSKSGALSA
jgi:hypothetical protein